MIISIVGLIIALNSLFIYENIFVSLINLIFSLVVFQILFLFLILNGKSIYQRIFVILILFSRIVLLFLIISPTLKIKNRILNTNNLNEEKMIIHF